MGCWCGGRWRTVRLRLINVEPYGPSEADGSCGPGHRRAMAKSPFSSLLPGDLYFQKYGHWGFGWGLSIRGEGNTNYLVRGVEVVVDGVAVGELGLTDTARLAGIDSMQACMQGGGAAGCCTHTHIYIYIYTGALPRRSA